MTEKKAFDYLDNIGIYNHQKLSAVMSPVGGDLAKIIDKRGQKEKLSAPKIFSTPDGIEVKFFQRTQLTLSSPTHGFTYQLLHFTDHDLVVLTKFNIKNEPISTLFLPTKGELQYEKPDMINTLYFDYLSRQLYTPLKQPTDPNLIKTFYQKTRSLLFELRSSI
jgi:hypothetical protein